MARSKTAKVPSSAVRQRERPQSPTGAPVHRPSSGEPYEVGYGKPPKHAQFQPGQSGNPNGRPKGARSPFALLRQELQQNVTLRENGRETTVSKLEAIMKRVVADTLSGKPSQTKLLFALLHQLEAQDAASPSGNSLSRSDEELLRNLLKGFGDE